MKRTIVMALAAGLAAVAGGCAGLTGDDPAEAPKAQTPQEKLLDAVPDGSQGNFRFTLKDAELTGKGVMDPATKRLLLTTDYKDADLGFTMTMGMLVIDEESWMKITFANTDGLTGLPKLPKKWLRLDRSKVKDQEDVGFDDPDPAGANALFRAIVAATESGAGTFTGTLDLTRATEAEIVDQAALDALGQQAKAVPFTANVDSQGRLAAIEIKVPAHGDAKAYTHQVTYADYGAAPAIEEPPANQVAEATQEAYDLLNS